MELTISQLEAVWNAGNSARLRQNRNLMYYKGNHAIIGRSQTYADGVVKSELVTNWIAYGVDSYVGALTSSPFTLTADESGDVSTYQALSDELGFDIMDVEHLRTCLIAGQSIETYEFANGAIQITRHDPREFVCLWDDQGILRAAIRQVTLPIYSAYNDAVLEAEKYLLSVYTANTITDYEKIYNVWTVVNEVRHGFGRVPVVVWSINYDRIPLITDDVIGQQDEYNDIDTISGDDIRYHTNAKLIIQNCDANWLMDNSEKINAMNMLPLPEGAEASYLTKGNDVERIEARLTRVRENIHMRLGVPDINQIVGATGATSGIALKLKFQPMMYRASSMIHYLRQAINDRVEMINALNGRLRRPLIDGYQVQITFVMPTNRIEEWANIGALKGIVSHQTQLALLSDIKDPQKELEEVDKETQGATGDIQQQLLSSLTAEDIQAANIQNDLTAVGR